MKRYAVFAFTRYEAGGGWNDNIGLFATLKEAQQAGFGLGRSLGAIQDSGHIVDLVAGEVVLYWNDDTREWATP
jgi:hypothetical protein